MTLLNASIGQEIFLQNDFLSFALNGSGTLGTKGTAPTGFATDKVSGYVRLGMVADTDGFGVGAAQTRDVMLAGTPVETFILGYKQGATKYVHVNSERDGKMDIKGVASNLSDSDAVAAGWAGATAQGLKVNQVMSMTEDAKFVRVDVTITNSSATDATDLRYMRSIDPDHGPSFSTNNVVVEQGGDGGNGALIAAYASKTSTPFYFYTQDDRAIVSTFGLENRDPYALAATTGAQAEGAAVSADVAINMNFGLGTLAAGQSTTITYYMGVTNNLTATIAAINAASDAPEASPPPPPPVNHAPVATNDSLTVASGLSGSGNVLNNDLDSDGNALSAALKTGPANGTLTLAADGTFKYTPKAGFSGSDSFTYTVSDGSANAVGTVNLTVTPPPNKAPVATADALSVVAGTFASGSVLANDTDPDGDALTVSIKTGPSNGTLTLAADGTYKYTPKAGYSGSDSFTYTLSDGKTTSTGTVSVTVAPPPNQGPTAGADSLSVTAGTVGTGNVLSNDADADGDVLTAALKTGPAHGSLSLAADGSFSYTPTAGYSGADSFTYTVSDGKAGATGVVTLSVTPKPNNGPTAVGESISLAAGEVGVGNVLSNDTDADGDALQASVVTSAANGVVSVAADGAFSYTPNAGFSGSDSFTYAITDGQASSSATVSVTVAPAPIVVPPVEVEPEPVDPAATVHNGSASTNQVLTGTSGQDRFFFETAAKSGADAIVGFGADDLLVTSAKLYDGNNDGLIGFQGNKLSLDAPKAGDTVVIGGVSALRLMGTDADGNYLYANAATMPKGAVVSKTTNDVMKGDAKDKSAQTFFFNTGLELDFGSDRIMSFGARDTIVTTSALELNASGRAVASSGRISLGEAAGDLTITNLKGAAVTQLDFDGTVEHGGMTYFVYSAADSAYFHTVSF